MKAFFSKWCWQMAWRDSRAHRGRLFLFLSCICLGVAALVALRAFGSSVRDGIVEQSRSLLGGDVLVKSRQPIPKEVVKSVDELAVQGVQEWRFATMGKFPNSDNASRLIQLRGVEKGFPLYGEIGTLPVEAPAKLRDGSKSALIDESLVFQFGIKVGDPVVLGEQTFTVAGYLKSLPGESFIISELAPRILIDFKDIESTGLIGFGSRVRYRHYFKLNEGFDKVALKYQMDDLQTEHGIRYETTEDRQEAIDKTLSNLFHFLNLVAFIALLLGGIGIGSAIRVHISSKLQNAAILRCVGASKSQSINIYVIQSLMMGLVGGIAGSTLGLILQEFIPALLNSFLPLQVETRFSWEALGLGIGAGVVITLLFSLTPLLKLNKMTAADSLRSSVNIDHIKTPWEWPIKLILASLVMGFSIMSANTLKIGVALGGGMLGSLLFLVFLAWVLMNVVRRTVPDL
ncbi:MAG: ABC transporter permease [Lentisphaerales bacterium]|nr:ABC transporter permease [Lentisphaerales bacterium]